MSIVILFIFILQTAANNAAPDSVAIGNDLCKKLWLTLGFLLVMGNAILVSYFAAQVMTLSAEVANLTSRGSMGPPGPSGLMGPIGPPGQKGCSVCPKVAGHPQASGPVESNEASCPEGYTKFRETCYKAFNTLANFGDSALYCRVDGGTLAMPRDAATDTFLISLKNAVDDKSTFWFGLHDRRKEGSFEWIDGSALGSYNSWAPGEPNNKRVNEDCVHYWPFYYESACANKWNDEKCDFVSFFICQVAPGRP
ncbi:perlucin-like protein [Branchiostoma floridae x Branchiostoma belcheri]